MSSVGMTVVVPCLDEEANIEPVYREIITELGDYRLEVLFVDDGSTDRTLDEIERLARVDRRVHYLSLSRNFGVESAFSAGYRYAGQEWILHLDADQQFPAAGARDMLAVAQRDRLDAVFAIRAERNDSALRRAASGLHDFLARRILRIEIPPKATTFRLIRADLARRIVDLDQSVPYFLATVPRLTNRWASIPTHHRARARGSSKVSVRGLAKHAVDLFLGFSDRPMFMAARLLVGSALLCLIALLIVGFGSARLGELVLAAAGGVAALCFALTIRFLAVAERANLRTPRFLVREANIDVLDSDRLSPAAHTERRAS